MATTKEKFAEIDSRLKAEPGKFKEEVDGVFKFVLTGDDSGTWMVDCKDAVGVTEADGEADCTLEMEGEAFVQIVDGTLDGMQAFMMGQIQVEGDMALAMKLQELF